MENVAFDAPGAECRTGDAAAESSEDGAPGAECRTGRQTLQERRAEEWIEKSVIFQLRTLDPRHKFTGYGKGTVIKMKKRRKIEQTIFAILMLAGFMVCGGFVGFTVGRYQKSRGGNLEATEGLLLLLGCLLLIYFAFFVNVCLHETGHMIFGLLTGYRFSSIRFGSFMLVKAGEKVKPKRMSVPGTLGQCLMRPPAGSGCDFPTTLYNLGGILVNGIVVCGCLTWYALLPEKDGPGSIVPMAFVLTGLTMIVTNGVPFRELSTDGANALLLKRDRNARRAFRNSLEIVNALADGRSAEELPEGFFAYAEGMPFDNPLVTGQAVSRMGWLVQRKRFREAYEFGSLILETAESTHELHELLLRLELIYIKIVEYGDVEEAKGLYEKDQKRFRKLAASLTYQRVAYAYYTMCRPDEKKAAESRKLFEKLAAKDPYKGDAEAERELFQLVEEQARRAPEQA